MLNQTMYQYQRPLMYRTWYVSLRPVSVWLIEFRCQLLVQARADHPPAERTHMAPGTKPQAAVLDVGIFKSYPEPYKGIRGRVKEGGVLVWVDHTPKLWLLEYVHALGNGRFFHLQGRGNFFNPLIEGDAPKSVVQGVEGVAYLVECLEFWDCQLSVLVDGSFLEEVSYFVSGGQEVLGACLGVVGRVECYRRVAAKVFFLDQFRASPPQPVALGPGQKALDDEVAVFFELLHCPLVILHFVTCHVGLPAQRRTPTSRFIIITLPANCRVF